MGNIIKNKFLISFVIFIGFFLFTIIILNSFFPQKIVFYTDYIYLVYILLFYLNIYILYYIFQTYDKNKIKRSLKNIYTKLLFFIIISILLYIYVYKGFDKNLLVYNVITVELFVFAMIFNLDSRLMFLIALNLLGLTQFYILIGNKNIAENLSIYAYYYLVMGTIISIIEQLINKDNFYNDNNN